MGDSCPKCATTRDDKRTHCAKCGLAYSKMAAFEKQRDEVPAALTDAWNRAVEKWDDTARHDEILRLAGQYDAYPWAAARYREKDDVIATAQLDRIRRAAEATLLSTAAARADRTPEPYRNTMAVLAFLVILIVAGIVYALARGSTPSKVHRERVPVPPTATEVR